MRMRANSCPVLADRPEGRRDNCPGTVLRADGYLAGARDRSRDRGSRVPVDPSRPRDRRAADPGGLCRRHSRAQARRCPRPGQRRRRGGHRRSPHHRADPRTGTAAERARWQAATGGEGVTLESTVRAAGAIPRPGLWAIGRDHHDGVPADFEVNWDDWRRDTVWAETMLARHGVGRGTPVLIVGGMEESPWFDPFEHAVLNLGGHYCLGETHAFDAFRSALYARCLDVEVIVGINRAVVEGFGDKLLGTLGHARVILARPDTMPLFT